MICMKLLKSILIFLILFSTLVSQTLAQNDIDLIQKTDHQIEKEIDHYIDALPEPFYGTILMGIGDTILINKGYGMANLGYDVPNRANTKYSIGSITKVFTAVLVLQMVEKGQIDLNATIDKYLPYYPEKNAKRITIHHLLSHTSGIPHHFVGIPKYFEVEDKYFHTPKEYLKLFWDKELAHEPGEKMTYTSPGYYLLGVILELVTKKSYAELLKENIFKPLAMKNTYVYNNLTVQKHKATGYKKGLNGLVLAGTEEESNRLSAGAIMTTTEDLYRFQRALNFEGDNILSPKYKRMLFQINKFPFSYAGRIFKMPYHDGRDTLTILSAGGSSYGFRALFGRVIEKDACVIVLSNIQSANPEINEILDYVGDNFMINRLGIDEVKKAPASESSLPKPAKVNKTILSSYQGYYETEDNTIIGITLEGDQLVRRIPSQQTGILGQAIMRRALIPLSDSLFQVQGLRGVQYKFYRTSGQCETSIQIIRDDRIRDRAERIPDQPNFDLSEYQGIYYSVELQKTYEFSLKEKKLMADEFLDLKNPIFVPLRTDFFGCSKGFLFFHRDEEGIIRDFKLESDEVDAALGSMFIKK
jgi:CubicO group peptidase (beta-lactamase class C family)